MTDHADTRLAESFATLQRERERTWPEEKLRANAEQRRVLAETFDPAKVVAVGDSIVPFELEIGNGERLPSDRLLADGPVALIFFRFAGCPACNLALPHYDHTLAPALGRAGVRLLAVTPHLPERGAGDIAVCHALSFPVLSDRSNALARRLGLTFMPIGVPAPASVDPNGIGALTGTGSGELPMPALILLDEHGIVRFVDISPDWLSRTEADVVIAAVSRLAVAA